MSGEDDNPYAKYTLISDWLIFVTLTLAEIYVFVKLKFNLDFSGKLTLLLHFCVSGIRIYLSYLGVNDVLHSCTGTVANTLVWMSLYYFVFEL
jgi:hypothetical protein